MVNPILRQIASLPRDTADPIERAALIAYDRGCEEGHGPHKSIAWSLAQQIYSLKDSDGFVRLSVRCESCGHQAIVMAPMRGSRLPSFGCGECGSKDVLIEQSPR